MPLGALYKPQDINAVISLLPKILDLKPDLVQKVITAYMQKQTTDIDKKIQIDVMTTLQGFNDLLEKDNETIGWITQFKIGALTEEKFFSALTNKINEKFTVNLKHNEIEAAWISRYDDKSLKNAQSKLLEIEKTLEKDIQLVLMSYTNKTDLTIITPFLPKNSTLYDSVTHQVNKQGLLKKIYSDYSDKNKNTQHFSHQPQIYLLIPEGNKNFLNSLEKTYQKEKETLDQQAKRMKINVISFSNQDLNNLPNKLIENEKSPKTVDLNNNNLMSKI